MMRVLVLAPHPFYEERGTPIDVLLVLRVLAERPDVELELLTYHEGADVDLPGLTIHRIPRPWGIRDVRPGFSLKKIVCDVLMFLTLFRLLGSRRYDFIHAGEEAVFMSLFAKRYFGVPYAYDLDSSIAQQMVESRPWLHGLAGCFDRCETIAIRESLVAFPVCTLLADVCERAGAKRCVELYDISQLENPRQGRTGELRSEFGVSDDETLIVYTGNLEPYQGVDLLMDAFAVASRVDPGLKLVVIGGAADHVRELRIRIASLGLAGRAFAAGPRPFERLGTYLADADILVCPRIRGVNTPLKVFPYMHSGRPVVATRLPTHTQILTDGEAKLADPTPVAFARAIVELAADPRERERLGRSGRAFVERNHTYRAHRERLNAAYDWVREQLGRNPARRSSSTGS